MTAKHISESELDKTNKKEDDPSDKKPSSNSELLHSDDRAARDFAGIIGLGIAGCMRDRTYHKSVERQLDDWFRNLSGDRKQQVLDARKQIETARQALDLFYTRFRTIASGIQ